MPSTELLATSVFGPLPPRADYTCPSRARPERRIGLVEAIGDSAVGAMRGHAPALFDDFVGAQHYRWGYGKAKRFSGLEVHGHLKFCRKLHREIGRLFAAQDAIHIGGGATPVVYLVSGPPRWSARVMARGRAAGP